MVAIFTGNSFGLERGSAFVLGGRGQVGQASLGQAGQNVLVNAATGNLVITKQDELLIGRGADESHAVTYNGLAGDAAKWTMSPYRMITAIIGTPETEGSTVHRSNWDNHKETYVWEGGRYVYKGGGGAYDELRRSIVNGAVVWTWTDGDSRVSEVYTPFNGMHAIEKVIDSDNNIQTWSYASGLLDRITNANGDYIQYSWEYGRISQLTTSYTPSAGGSASLTRVRYGWDSLNRLLTVTVDLTPNDNVITDGNTYVTTYGYDGTSKRVKSISQTDGSLLEIEYDGSARVSRLVQTAATGVTRATNFAYGTGYTDVTDDQGGVTRLTYNANKELTQLTMPAALLNGPVQNFYYEYNGNGDVTKVIEAAGETVYTYDTNGNQTKVRDPLGNIVERVFDSTNHLLKETIFLVADSDGDGVATIPRTTRYIYNSLGHLRYVVTASGRVTRHGYNAYGWLGTTIEYRGRHYDLTGTTPATDLTLANLEAWAGPDATTDHSLEKKTCRLYDARGNLQAEWTFGLTNPDGTANEPETAVIGYVYDQAGNLLFKQRGNQPTESFLYDGLGRLKASIDANGNSTSIVFNDSANSTVVTLASGLTRTSVYNRAGELISFAESNATTTATTSYSYDSLGRLRIVTDPTGLKTHYLYDRAGRKVAEIGHDGSITQYSYNGDNLLVRTLRHGGKLNTDQLNSLISGGAPANVTLSSVTPDAHADDRYEWAIYDTAKRLIQTIDGTGATSIFSYDGASRLVMTTAYFTPIAETSVTAFKSATPTSLVAPSANAAVDRYSRNFFDADGLLIGTLDAEGALVEHFYDDAGLHSKSIRYFNPTENLDRTTRTLAQLRASLSADNDKDIHSYSLFDDRGVLRATIDGEGNLTRYRYQNLSGLLDQEVRGQKLDPAAVRTSPPRWNTLPAGVAAELETIDYLRNGAGDVTAMTRTLRGGAADSTTYGYDNVGNLVSSTIQGVGANDARTVHRRYDKFGRLIGELPGEGGVALAALGANPSTSAVDAVYLTWGTTYSYDLAGRLIASTRPNGTDASANRTIYYYDELDRLRFEMNPRGEVTEYRYNALGERIDTIGYGTRIGSTTLAGMSGGLVTQSIINLVTVDSLVDSRSSIEYGLNGTVKLTKDALLRTTSYSYNSFREMTGRTDPIGDGVGVSTVLAYDRRGLLTSETRDSGAGGLQLLTGFGYDSFGRRISVTDPDLKLRGTGYDRAGRVVRSTDATGAWQAITYDPLGNLLTSTDRTGKTTSYGYTNRTMTVTTPENVVTTTVRNAHGETLSITDGANRTVTYGYDKSGNLKSVTDAAGQLLNNYDKAGRLFEEIDARGVKTSYGYDAAARVLTRTVDAGPAGHLNLVTSYEYDARGRQVRIVDPSLVATRIEFDLNGRKTAVIAGDGGLNLKTAYSYDHGGRVLTVTEGAGTAAARVTTYEYDKAGRVYDAWVDKGAGGLNLRTHYLYDKRGNVTNVTDASGRVTVYTYDDENRQVLASDAEGRLTRTSYDAEGRVVATRLYAGRATLTQQGTDWGVYKYGITAVPADSASDEITSYVHDGDGRLRFSIDALGQPCEYVYDGSGNLVRKVAYAGAIAFVATDTVATVQTKIAAAGLAALAATRTTRAYFDSAGRQAYAVDAAGGVTAFGYDAASNLVKRAVYKAAYSGADSLSAVQTWAAAQPLADTRITRTIYDGASRTAYRAEETESGSYVTEFRYDGAGRLAKQIRYAAAYSVGDATTLAGLQAAIPSIPATAAVTDYLYDTAGRMTDTIDPEGSRTHFTLDASGLITDTIRAYLSTNPNDESRTHRIFDKGGRLTSETRGYLADEATTTSYSYDGVGRVLTVTDGRGFVTTRTYDAGGRVLTESVPIASGSEAVTEKFYDSFGNVVKVKDPRGNFGYFYYDALNRLTLQFDPEQYATAMTYTIGGEIATITRSWTPFAGTISETVKPVPPTHSLDATTTFTRDRLDRLTAVTDAENYTESYQLNAFGDRTSVTRDISRAPDPAVTATTNYTYDRLGRLISEQLPAGSTLSNGTVQSTTITNKFEYDARGNRTKTIEAFGLVEVRTTSFFYDRTDRLIEKRGDPVQIVAQDLATVTTITPSEYHYYDKRGNLVETKDAAGGRTLSYYDDVDRKVAELSAVGTLSTFEYDDSGNVEKSRVYGTALTLPATPGGTAPAAPGGDYRETTHMYDRANRRISSSVASLRTGAWNGSAYATSIATVTTTLGYDKNGNLTAEGDANGATIHSYYDKANRKTAQVDRENYLTVWTLNGDGNALTERRHQTRFIGTPGELAPSVANHADDRVTTFTYDRVGRRLSEERAAVATHSIDAGTGAATAATVAATIFYAYNGLGLVTRKTEANGDVSLYEYDGAGRMLRTKAPQFADHNGTTVLPLSEMFYDGLGNVVRTEVNRDGGASADDRVTTYSYGAGGRLGATTDAAGFTRNYGYDAAGRVVKESYVRRKSDGVTDVTEAVAYRYDAAGRLVTQAMATLSGGSWTFGDATRIRYNAYGEVSGKGITGGPNDAAIYQEVMDYDAGGRLWRSTSADGTLRFHIYDKAGNETLTLASTGADLSALTLADYANSIGSTGDTSISGAVTAVTIYDKRGQSTGTREPDRQLSASATAVIVRARTYNAFGEVASETEPRGFDASGNAISFSGGAGYTTVFTYNAMGRLLSKVSPQVSVTAENGAVSSVNPTEYYGYDSSGRRVLIDDANGNRTTRLLLAGSGHGGSEALVTKEFYPDTGVRQTKYDMFGDARVLINEVGSTETRDHDKMGRLTVQYRPVRAAGTYGNVTGAAVQLIDYFGYDGLGQRTQHWNSQLTATVKERTDYDAQGRVVSSVAFGGDTTGYGYAWNAALATSGLGTFGGWTKTIVNSISLTMTEAVDYFGRTVDRIDYGAHNYDFTFDKGGRLTARTNGAGESVAFTYYDTGLLSGQTGTQGVAGYDYDSAGNRTGETFSKGGVSYRAATATYDALGRMTHWADSGYGGAVPASTDWEYDKVGNVRRVASSYRALDLQGVAASTDTTIVEWYLYDSMNRFTLTKGVLTGERGSGTIERGDSGTAFTYYFDGNRRSALTRATVLGHHWIYANGPNGMPIMNGGGEGEPMGTWQLRTFNYQGLRREDYYYTADGFLAASNKAESYTDPGTQPLPSAQEYPEPTYYDPPVNGNALSRLSLDAMGRTVNYKEYGRANEGSFERTNIVYDAAGRQLSETTITLRADYVGGMPQTYTTHLTNTYTNGMLSEQLSDTYKNGTNQAADDLVTDSRQTYSYVWWDGALQHSIGNDNDNGGAIDWTTDYSYDSSGHLITADIDDGRDRIVTFRSDQNGMIVDRDEADLISSKGDPRSLNYFFAGMQMGQVGNNGTDNLGYVDSIKDRLAPVPTSEQGGAFRNNSIVSTPFADFAQSYDAINGYNGASTGSTYTAQGGETLMMIAQNVWGDSQLWYLIAQANGLDAGDTLVAGQVVTIPNKLHNSRNAADTFSVYNPNEAIGDTSPVDAKPAKKNKCATIGIIILAAIAVAVSSILQPHLAALFAKIGFSAAAAGAAAGATAAAAGSIVSQGVGVATGLQDKFNWKAVGIAAISGGITGGMGGKNMLPASVKSAFLQGAARGVVANVLTQGVSIATGLQKKFDWVGVVASAVVSGTMAELRGVLPPVEKYSLEYYGQRVVTGTAGALAGAATRTLLAGTDFADNIMSVLPDVIGQTIGEMVADQIQVTDTQPAAAAPAAAAPAAVAADPETLRQRAEERHFRNGTNPWSSMRLQGGESYSPPDGGLGQEVTVTGTRMTRAQKAWYDALHAGQLLYELHVSGVAQLRDLTIETLRSVPQYTPPNLLMTGTASLVRSLGYTNVADSLDRTAAVYRGTLRGGIQLGINVVDGTVRTAVAVVQLPGRFARDPGGTTRSLVNGLDSILQADGFVQPLIASVQRDLADLASGDLARIERGAEGMTIKVGTVVTIVAPFAPKFGLGALGSSGSTLRLAAGAEGTTTVASSARAYAILNEARNAAIVERVQATTSARSIEAAVETANATARAAAPGRASPVLAAEGAAPIIVEIGTSSPRLTLTPPTLRRVPNPYGKLGGPAHRAAVADIVADIQARGLTAIPEVRVLTPNGSKGARFIDVSAQDPITLKLVEYYQVGKQTLKGVPVAREVRALDDIEAVLGVRPTYVPYNK